MRNLLPEHLGTPALRVAGFQLWVHGREFPEATDYEDGNWLRVTAHCGASGASVWVRGSILRVTDIEGFRRQCERLLNGKATSAALEPYEPDLRITLESTDGLGHIGARVEITPDHLAQSHTLNFAIDQSYLPGIIKDCARIVEEHPVRGLDPTDS